MPIALIVEDEPEANKLLSRLVQLRGYRTESAFTGGEALEKMGRGRPDVVFLDLMLPDTTGFDVCRAIKARRETNPIPVVMVTARLAAENRAQSFRVGANDFVPKPYTPDQIFAALHNADAWRRELEALGSEGRIPLGTRGEAATFAAIARLGSLMLARTPWDEGDIRQLSLVLAEIGQEALDWARRTRTADVGFIAYALGPDRLDLVIHDLAGWVFPGDNNADRQRLDELIALGRFEVVKADPERCELALSKSFPTR